MAKKSEHEEVAVAEAVTPAAEASDREVRWAQFLARAEAQAAKYGPGNLAFFKERVAKGDFKVIPPSFQ